MEKEGGSKKVSQWVLAPLCLNPHATQDTEIKQNKLHGNTSTTDQSTLNINNFSENVEVRKD